MEPMRAFIVAGESTVREGLCSNLPWERLGFSLVGDAPDGELALTKLRRLKPDVLITEIDLPYLDGISLCTILRKENPQLKIILMDGRNSFESAWKAISLGVSAYLPKPVTVQALRSALEKIYREYPQEAPVQASPAPLLTPQRYLEQLLDGSMTVQETVEKGEKLGFSWEADTYSFVVFMLQGKQWQETMERLMRFFRMRPVYYPFRCGQHTCAVLVRGATQERLDGVTKAVAAESKELQWYAAVGSPTDRLSGLPDCFDGAMHALSYRYMLPNTHVFTQIVPGDGDAQHPSPDTLTAAQLDCAVFRRFVQTEPSETAARFAADYVKSLGGVVKNLFFRYYLMMTARIQAGLALEEMGCSREHFLKCIQEPPIDSVVGTVETYLADLLRTAVQMRELSARQRSSDVVDQAVKYIDKNYKNQEISLQSTAKSINVSANYLSALFHKKMGVSFVDYLTQKRMVRARQLLRQTNKHAGEIAKEVGYPDPRYFSYVFKKTQGCTPGKFRNGENDGI